MKAILTGRSHRSGRAPWLTALLTGLMLFPAVPAAQAQTEQEEIDRTISVLTEMRVQLQDDLNSLDHTLFDLEAVKFEVGFMEPEEILAYLQERIRFEQYPGLLRGEKGTLIAGAGNALDQSLLLVHLLLTAGYDVQIQRGELDTAQAEHLVRQIRPASNEAAAAPADETLPFDFDPDDLEALSERISSEAQRLSESAGAAERFLTEELDRAGIELGAGQQADLVQEARDYFWVEYRLGEQDDWTALHVAFTDPPASLADLAGQALPESIPQELLHQVRIEAFIEQRLGNELESRPVMTPWTAATANIIGHPITFVNVPDGLGRVEMSADFDDVLAATNFYVPLLNNRNSAFDGTQSFDLNGSSVDSAVAEDQAAALFGTIGGLFGQAAGALAGEENPDDFVTLSAQWLEYTIVAPGGQETVHRRTVFDRIGTENREAGLLELSGEVSSEDMQRALTSTHTLVIAAGEYRAEYVTGQVLSGGIAMLDNAIEALENAESGDVPEADTSMTAHLNHLQLYAAAGQFALPEGAVAYRHEPALIVMEESWIRDFGRVDVISNAQRVLRTSPAGLPEHAPDLALRAGIWETRLEGIPFSIKGWDMLDTFTAFEAAAEHGIPHVTLTAAADLDGLDLPAATINAIEADLADGFVVITPVSLPDATAIPGWWRVNAVTGETLGRGGDGRGQATSEYLGISSTQWGLLVSFATGYSSCVVNSGNWTQFACCTVEAAAMTAAGGWLGGKVASAFAWGALEAFLLMDVSMGVGTLVYGTALNVVPSFCSGLGEGNCQFLIEI